VGLLDKFKNLFTDEEVIEVTKEIEVEERPPQKLPKVMQDQIEKLELTKEILKKDEEISDRDIVKTKTKFNFPVEFKDEEVVSNRNVLSKTRLEKAKEEPKKLYNMTKEQFDNTKSLYKEPKKEEKKKFYSSPIISPVYGILDKNYKKEELLAKDENSYEIPRGSKKVDFETIRQKAFGTLADEIKDNLLCDDCELKKASLKIKNDDLMYDISIEKEEKEKDEQKEENYDDFGISYELEDEKVVDNVKTTKIDIDIEVEEKSKLKEENTSLEDDILKSGVEIVDCNDSEVVAEKIEVKEDAEEKIKDSLELTDDLYNLIDSMYQDREE